MKNPQSFGGGYGINRKAGGAGALKIAVPPLSHITVKPGCGHQMTGGTKIKAFQGAKIYKNK
jgi:hypothetical protein